MLDTNILRNELDVVAEKLASRKFTCSVEKLRAQEERRNRLQVETEKIQAERKYISKEIGAEKYSVEEISQRRKEVKKLGERLTAAKYKLELLQRAISDYAMSLPSIPADDVPYGSDDNDNIEVLRWGKPRKYDFKVRDHVLLGDLTGGMDFAAAVKLTGSCFVVMHGQIARMHRALSQFMLDLHTEQHGYQEHYLPYLVNHTSLYGTGQLPKLSEDLLFMQPLSKEGETSAYALIPTAEVPLTNMLRDQILDEDALPLKMTAHTPCFRSEAGSYGSDTRGLIRMHQFDKVEMVQVVKPSQSMNALEEMTGHAEKVLQLLNLPYRKVLLCTGDISFASCKTYDLEVWLPAQKKYIEISSCSNIWDFQARRMQMRYRSKEDKKTRLLHTLNGSGLAIGRTLVAVLENYQLVDGRIEVPTVLQPYMQGLTYIG